MDQATQNKIVSFIWGIADDVLRDLFKRGKYPDVILPMFVLRRFDAVLEPTKADILKAKAMLDKAKITSQNAALCDAAKQVFYNTSKFTLRDLKSRGSQQQLLSDFEDYLNGFSPNVQDILENFKFRNQLQTLSKADALGTLINKFLDPEIDLSPAGIDNHGMGSVFEELVRKFNEENNEEAGEHWTPRDAVRLMANLVFLPIQDQLKSGSYLLYDCACGTGGMLTVAEETMLAITAKRKLKAKAYLYGQEINPETYAVCKADMLLKGEGENADHIVGGAEHSTLSHDAFPAQEFDFMLANPPYGKSWKKDLEAMGGKDGMRDPRFMVMHKDEELSLVTRSSDGQLLFLANMVSKMNNKSALGSRIAEVHNGSSLFTGDAGQGESNIRRWIIENDWCEAIVALPLNLFYNTGIATYIWVLTNRKPAHRKGKVQLIDASQWFKALRKNLGKKNCELAPEDIERISQIFLDFKETPESKIFPNEAFGYWKVVVERPLRLHSQFTVKAIASLRYASGDEDIRAKLHDEFGDDIFKKFEKLAKKVEKRLADWGGDDEEAEDDDDAPAKKGLSEKKKKKLLDAKTWERDGRLVEIATTLKGILGDKVLEDYNVVRARVDEALEKKGLSVTAADLKQILKAVSWSVETAAPVIAKVHKPGKVKADPLKGLFEAKVDGKPAIVEYETDSDLRDTEQVPLLEKGGIEAFFKREVLPYTPDAWIKEDATKIGYEVSFTRHFYKPQPLRTLEQIRADIQAIEKESESLLDDLLKGGRQVKASEAKLLAFLQRSSQFIIPIYQRTYSWTDKQCRQLWDDILRAGSSDAVTVHFVGSIVYVEQGLSQVTNQTPVLVIDGQQRLTTVTLLIEALARALGDAEPVEGFSALKMRQYYLCNPLEKDDKFFKLLLTQTDKESLKALVKNMEAPQQPSLRVTQNFELFNTLLAENKDNLKAVCLGLAKLVVVDVALSRDQDNPQLIFESMNSTGKELSQADLIRNFILMGLEPTLQTHLYEHFWRPMELEFGQEAYGTQFDGFVRHYLTVKTGDIPRTDEVYEAFKGYARREGVVKAGVEALVKDLRDFARYFCAMDLGSEKDPVLNQAFRDLGDLKVDVAYPLLLELYHDYDQKSLSAADFVTAVRLVEAYVFRRAICNIPTNSMNKTFSTFGKSLKKERYLESLQAHLLNLPSYRRFPADDEFRRAIQTRDLYNFRSKMYWLRRFENHGRKERVTVDEYTVEHILPQNENLSAAWKEALGTEWERIRQEKLHTLGNLTLTGYNSEYSDRSFIEKRDMKGGFAESPLKVNAGLGKLDAWNEAAIEERAGRLAATAVDVWPAPKLAPEVLLAYKPKAESNGGYTIDQHPHLLAQGNAELFNAFRKEVLALDPCVTEQFLKLYVAYKAETNFVDVIPQAKRFLLSLNMKFAELNDPKGVARDVTGMGRWGNGDVEVSVSNVSELPYVMGLVRQSYDRQMGEGGRV